MQGHLFLAKARIHAEICSLLTGKDENVNAVENVVCLMYEIEETGVKDTDNARHSLFVKAKRALKMSPPTIYALELHIKRKNYQVNIWFQANHAIMNLENELTETIGSQESTGYL